jgi:hypothetical protein
MDFFLNDNNCSNRLLEEYKKYGTLIVAYDYDNTVFDYYNMGNTFNQIKELLRECKKLRFHLVVFTSCTEDRFPEIIKYLGDNDIPFDSINETPDFIPFKGRKVYYNILLDDRAGLKSSYDQLTKVVYTIKGINSTNNLVDFG